MISANPYLDAMIPGYRKLLEANTSVAQRVCGLFVIFLLLFSSHAQGQSFKETYPRIARFDMRNSNDLGDPEFRQRLARHDILVLGTWRGFSVTDNVTGERLRLRDVVVDIKNRAQSIGNRGILVGKYTNINESGNNPDNSASRDKWDKLHSETGPGYPRNNDWYARDKNGEHTGTWPGSWLTNVTDFVQRDANGDTYSEWVVRRDYDLFFRDTPELDLWFFDNWFYRPRVDADWDGDGVDDDRNDPAVRTYFRQGYRDALDRARELAPGMVFMGNADGDAPSNNGMLTEPEYRGQLTAIHEGAMGQDWSAETWGGWKMMMRQYQTTIFNAQHNVAIMNVKGDEHDYAMMRYGLASCLLDNGYYYYSLSDRTYTANFWFDEYDIDLGRAIDPPQFDEWQNGVYRRRFENGMAIVNPKGNGTRTVQIGPGYKRFSGTQDPSTNNGQVAESVTLGERDGLILVRIDGPATDRPKPPVLDAL